MNDLELSKTFNKLTNSIVYAIKKGKFTSRRELIFAVNQTVKKSINDLFTKSREYIRDEIDAFNANKSDNDIPQLNGIATTFSAVKRASEWELRGHFVGIQTSIQNKINSIVKTLAKDGKDTVINIHDSLAEEFSRNGVMNVQYANGALVKGDNYAKMVARTAKSECNNLDAINSAKRLNTDIVEIVGNSNTCSVCAQYRGRWYSVSGKSTEYPPLYGTVFSNGYNVIHPNCRCTVNPIILEAYDPEEITKKKLDSNAPFEDSRSKREKEAYDNWQELNRRNWKEHEDYEEIKKLAGRGNELPYKTLGAFRRASRSAKKSTKFQEFINHKKN